MFAHLLDIRYFERLTVKGEDQAIESGKVNGELALPITFERMAPKPRKSG